MILVVATAKSNAVNIQGANNSGASVQYFVTKSVLHLRRYGLDRFFFFFPKMMDSWYCLEQVVHGVVLGAERDALIGNMIPKRNAVLGIYEFQGCLPNAHPFCIKIRDRLHVRHLTFFSLHQSLSFRTARSSSYNPHVPPHSPVLTACLCPSLGGGDYRRLAFPPSPHCCAGRRPRPSL